MTKLRKTEPGGGGGGCLFLGHVPILSIAHLIQKITLKLFRSFYVNFRFKWRL